MVTIATDGFDRYPSVLANLAQRTGEPGDGEFGERFEAIFRGGAGDVLDVRPREQKERLFQYKEEVWKPFGYSQTCLDAM